MKIQFTDKDPRAGRIAELGETRARQFIADGLAVELGSDDKPAARAAPAKTSKKRKKS